MSALEKYSSYKDSRIHDSIQLPKHWKIKRFKHMFSFGKGLSITKENLEDDGIECVNYGEIHSKYGFEVNPEIHALKCVNESYLKNGSKSLLNFGDFVFADTSEDIEGSGNFTHLNSSKHIFAGYHTVICRPRKTIHSKYFAYLLDSQSFRSQIQKRVKGVKVYSITQNVLKDTFIWIPDDDEQIKIANFLDTKITKVDEAINQKEELIKLLKERRQVLIHKAVTQGLDSTVKMKDSGVEWIGEIPVHWNLLPGFKVYKQNKSKNTGMIENTVLSLSYGNIVIKPEEKLVGLVPESFETYQIVNPGDIIIRCMDLQNDKTSLRTGIARDRGIITSAYLNLNVFNNVIPEYLHHYLHMLDITKVLYKFGTGLRQNLSYFDFKRLPIVFSNKQEQQEILDFIETNTTRIDTLIKLQEEYIHQLKEYKGTFIDSCVTGKVKVF